MFDIIPTFQITVDLVTITLVVLMQFLFVAFWGKCKESLSKNNPELMVDSEAKETRKPNKLVSAIITWCIVVSVMCFPFVHIGVMAVAFILVAIVDRFGGAKSKATFFFGNTNQ